MPWALCPVSQTVRGASASVCQRPISAVLAAAQQEASPWGVLSVLLIFLVGAVLYFGVLPRMLKKEGTGK